MKEEDKNMFYAINNNGDYREFSYAKDIQEAEQRLRELFTSEEIESEGWEVVAKEKYLAKNYDKEVQFNEEEVPAAKEYWGVEEECESLEDVAFWWNSKHSGDAEGELVVYER